MKTVDMATNTSGSGSNGGYPSSLKCLFCQASVRFEGLPATLYEIHLSKLIFFSTQNVLHLQAEASSIDLATGDILIRKSECLFD